MRQLNARSYLYVQLRAQPLPERPPAADSISFNCHKCAVKIVCSRSKRGNGKRHLRTKKAQVPVSSLHSEVGPLQIHLICFADI